MAELVIRRAEERDIGAIEEIEQQCFSVPWTYESLRHDILENKLSFYIVAEVGERVCGYVGIWKILDEGHITNVAVSPDFRRKHIASGLLDVLVETCCQAGIEHFTLEVRAGNEAAKRLYAAKGFVEAGIRKGYYEDNGEDAVIMWKNMSVGPGGSGAGGTSESGASESDAGGSDAGRAGESGADDAAEKERDEQ